MASWTAGRIDRRAGFEDVLRSPRYFGPRVRELYLLTATGPLGERKWVLSLLYCLRSTRQKMKTKVRTRIALYWILLSDRAIVISLLPKSTVS